MRRPSSTRGERYDARRISAGLRRRTIESAASVETMVVAIKRPRPLHPTDPASPRITACTRPEEYPCAAERDELAAPLPGERIAERRDRLTILFRRGANAKQAQDRLDHHSPTS
jgi:hypothetical protein